MSEDGSITFEYPEGWNVEVDDNEEDGGVKFTISNDEFVLGPTLISPMLSEDQAVITIRTSESGDSRRVENLSEYGTDDFLTGYYTGFIVWTFAFAEAFTPEDERTTITMLELGAIEVAGQDATFVVLSGVNDQLFTVVNHIDSDSLIVVEVTVASGSLADFQETIDHVLASINYSAEK
ncbi:MAG: hypothetical protein L0154_22645 [Chloroflexi bacterium]|nr:hypothetical protein [Chloroflexota bacterium]